MSYSLHTLNGVVDPAAESEAPRSLWVRFALEISLLLGGAVLALVLLALLSHHPGDAAWSTSGAHGATRNWVGRLGAWLSDLAYFAFGYSVWWCWAAGLRGWLSGFSRWLRSEGWGSAGPREDAGRGAWVFWLGLVVLLASSCVLEWSRLYRWDAHLPGESGGEIGRAHV